MKSSGCNYYERPLLGQLQTQRRRWSLSHLHLHIYSAVQQNTELMLMLILIDVNHARSSSSLWVCVCLFLHVAPRAEALMPRCPSLYTGVTVTWYCVSDCSGCSTALRCQPGTTTCIHTMYILNVNTFRSHSKGCKRTNEQRLKAMTSAPFGTHWRYRETHKQNTNRLQTFYFAGTQSSDSQHRQGVQHRWSGIDLPPQRDQ